MPWRLKSRLWEQSPPSRTPNIHNLGTRADGFCPFSCGFNRQIRTTHLAFQGNLEHPVAVVGVAVFGDG